MEESAIGEALKVISGRKTKKTVRVCDECSAPLIWTFAFPYCERFCLNCGAKGGMLGTGKDVPATRNLIFKKAIIDALWKVIYGKKGFIPDGSRMRGCKACEKDNESHRKHMKTAEKDWDTLARIWMKKLQGTFDEKE